MTESCWALVAVKQRAECKARLAARLTADARLALQRLMLDRVLGALRAARTIDRIAVVSPERDTVPSDIVVLEDAGHGLNAALEAARHALLQQGATALVVLPADLPLVTAADIDTLIDNGRRAGFAIAADAAGTGTNALYLPCATDFRFQFGPGSRRHHMEEALRLGLKPALVRARGLEFDLDVAEDLERLHACADPYYASLPLFANGGPWPSQTCLG
jgi:2-phospho-L-lactate guanylyltransferase